MPKRNAYKQSHENGGVFVDLNTCRRADFSVAWELCSIPLFPQILRSNVGSHSYTMRYCASEIFAFISCLLVSLLEKKRKSKTYRMNFRQKLISFDQNLSGGQLLESTSSTTFLGMACIWGLHEDFFKFDFIFTF